MSAIGTGYDLSASELSPDGRTFQVEYAKKAVDRDCNVIAIKGKDCVVIATEKSFISKLFHEPSSPRIFRVDEHISCGIAGSHTDGMGILHQARSYAEEFRQDHGYPIPLKILRDRVGYYVHAYTTSSSVRPFGATLIFTSYDEKPQLCMIEPCGTALDWKYVAVGKAKQSAKAELEKLKREQLSPEELVKEAARVIYSVHDAVKDKPGFLLELSWVGKNTNGMHQFVPETLYNEAKQYAESSLKDESSEEEME